MPGERRASRFCCGGCEAVHALLVSEGLERFYELGGGLASGAIGGLPRVPSFDWLPDCENSGCASGLVRLALDVQGIRCAACVWLLQTVWRRLPGARALHVDPSLGRAVLTYPAGSSVGREFLQAAARFGYAMAPASRRLQRDSGLLVRLGICSAIAMNGMILSASLYFGLDAAAGDAGLRALFTWVLFGLSFASVLVGGPVFFRSALAGVRAGVVHMDLPISLGILLGFLGSAFSHLAGGPSYFDAVATFIAFMLGGRFLQQRTLARSRDQVLADDGAEHLRARVVRDGAVRVLPVLDLAAGDELLLAPGDLLPVRAVVEQDAASFSLDWINGESEPVAFARGEEVPAGAFQGGRAAVRVRAAADYRASGLAELLGQPPIDREDTRGKVRFWQLLNRYYAIAVLVAALLGGALWMVIDPTRALQVVVAILVVTCPCALGIAAPLAFHLALAMLRRRGVFVRSRSLLDKARCVRKVVFDKTGTLTLGGLRAEALQLPAGEELAALATMAASSNHPVSAAVLAALVDTPFRADAAVHEVVGQGLEAVVDGRRYRLGSPAFAGVANDGGGGRECAFARDGEVLARFRLEEDFRGGAEQEIAWLRRRGCSVHLLSGDRDERTARAAQRLGIDARLARGGLTAADKAHAIAGLDRGDTMMVGDGLNDAPAFAAAFCAGTPAMDRPVLPARSDFCFRSEHGGAVRAVLEVADLHAHVQRANLVLAVVYNTLALLLCFAGRMSPGLCAVLMPISSVALVVHTSLRFGRRRTA